MKRKQPSSTALGFTLKVKRQDVRIEKDREYSTHYNIKISKPFLRKILRKYITGNPEKLDERFNRIAQRELKRIIGKGNEKVKIGYAVVFRNPERALPAQISRLYPFSEIEEAVTLFEQVAAKMYARGIGKIVMEKIIKDTKGNTSIHILLPENNALDLYRKLGFYVTTKGGVKPRTLETAKTAGHNAVELLKYVDSELAPALEERYHKKVDQARSIKEIDAIARKIEDILYARKKLKNEEIAIQKKCNQGENK